MIDDLFRSRDEMDRIRALRDAAVKASEAKREAERRERLKPRPGVVRRVSLDDVRAGPVIEGEAREAR